MISPARSATPNCTRVGSPHSVQTAILAGSQHPSLVWTFCSNHSKLARGGVCEVWGAINPQPHAEEQLAAKKFAPLTFFQGRELSQRRSSVRPGK